MIWIQVGLWGLCLSIGIGSYIYRSHCQGYQRLQATEKSEEDENYMV
jgi:hypothetical protein